MWEETGAVHIILAAVVGLSVGSFMNVVIHRVPRNTENAASAINDLLTPGSACPACGTRLGWRQLIPVLSYLFQGGNCVACEAAISPRYPLVELAAGVVPISALFCYGVTTAAVAVSVLMWLMITIAVIDLQNLIVPDRLVFPLLGAGLLVNAFGILVESEKAILGAVVGFMSFWLMARAAREVIGRTALGGGDVKLFAALGAWLGWQALAPILLIASVTGLVVGLFLRLTGRLGPKAPIPFAPFLAFGGILMLFIRERLTSWLATFGLF